MTLLDQTINEYMDRYGEPEYRYFKKNVTWVKYRRKPGYHSSPVGDGTEVSKDEYDANIVISKKYSADAFMGKLPCSYWRYDRKLSKDGWREALIKDIQSARLNADPLERCV